MKNQKKKVVIGVGSGVVIIVLCILIFAINHQSLKSGNSGISTDNQQVMAADLRQEPAEGTEQEPDAEDGDLYNISDDYGWTGDITDETRTEFIDHFMGEGASKEEPFYEFYGIEDSYRNAEGELQLELYYDEATGVGCGIRYERIEDDEDNLSVNMKGFAFNTIETLTDNPESGEGGYTNSTDAFSVTYYDGSDGRDSVEDYEESYEYNDAGQLTHYESTGRIDWLKDTDEIQRVIKADFTYREDGTLCRKEGYYNTHIFGTAQSSYVTYFDEQQRVMYRQAYITHGSLDYYYIYDGDGASPCYVLMLDDNLGSWLPSFSNIE